MWVAKKLSSRATVKKTVLVDITAVITVSSVCNFRNLMVALLIDECLTTEVDFACLLAPPEYLSDLPKYLRVYVQQIRWGLF